MTIDLTEIIGALITIIFAIISRYLIPWIKSKVDAGKLETIKIWVKVAVEAAEQIYNGTGRGAEKKAYVESFLKSKGFVLQTSEIENLIEAAVLEITG